ncbi:transporter [Terrihabitans soli]|uniref:Transporter n=1 Tax=Terrihabitans soli TaxID=708113 RepID=A0A6S6QUL7_9HYPH|nr:LysE family translocator [Terrihabitans soli]BCJ90942.1 transporter [Terrihabitans soli]
MMDLTLYLAFVGAATILIIIPGPNVSLIIANSVAHGPRYGLLTVAGTGSALVVQLVLASLGLSGLMHTMGVWFEILRWIGAAYLVWLGLKMWLAPPDDLSRTKPEKKSTRKMLTRAFFVSLTNPKTLLFYGAFFPQFISESYEVWPQIVLMSVTFLIIALVLDSSWALTAGSARRLLSTHAKWRNRISGSLLMGAGIGMALARSK